ncbi:MAG: HU family DNA-binding protein [Chitinophagales bacterium]|nr:HU family DNA-binding protein [Chitinophagales bacterium]MDW8428820.1 HU family DNA-binding protein [Chitinophagales bacterium]
MNKGELIVKIAKDAKISKTAANAALDSFINNTMSALKKGDRVVLVGFGTFMVVRRAARKGRVPRTGQTVTIPARKVVKFKVGKEFAAKVR